MFSNFADFFLSTALLNTLHNFLSVVSFLTEFATLKKTTGTTRTKVRLRNISPTGFTIDAEGPAMAPHAAPMATPSRSNIVWI